jgi:hypothetical protein
MAYQAVTLTRQLPSLAGTAASDAGGTAAGDAFKNSGAEVVHIKNGATSTVATFVAAAGGSATPGGAQCSMGVAGTPGHDLAVTVAGSAEMLVGPFPPNRFSDANGLVQISWSNVTSVTLSLR